MPQTSPTLDTKRLSLTVPLALYEELERVAHERQGASVPELLRTFIRMGLLLIKETDHGGQPTTLVLRDGEKEREIFLL